MLFSGLGIQYDHCVRVGGFGGYGCLWKEDIVCGGGTGGAGTEQHQYHCNEGFP